MKNITMTKNMSTHQGFSLIELLIGLMIGLIGLLVVFQVVSVWSKQAHTSSTGSDAQITGTQAMFALERDLRQAGMGFSNSASTGCIVNSSLVAAPANAVAALPFSLIPVEIIYPGVGGNPGNVGDPVQINVLYGNSQYFTERQAYAALNSTNTTKASQQPYGFQVNDYVVIENSNATCPIALVSVTGVNGAAVSHTDDGTFGVLASLGGYLNDLGPSPSRNVWQIASPQNGVSYLQMRNEFPAPFTITGGAFRPFSQIAEGVINLQAQYGTDGSDGTAPDLSISAAEWTTAVPASWSNVLAIRVAILVRSQQFEKPNPNQVTPVAPSWAGGAFVMKNVDGTTTANPAIANDWHNYRYRVYEKVIPIRNLLWKCTHDCAH